METRVPKIFRHSGKSSMLRRNCRGGEPRKELKPGVGLVANELRWVANNLPRGFWCTHNLLDGNREGDWPIRPLQVLRRPFSWSSAQTTAWIDSGQRTRERSVVIKVLSVSKKVLTIRSRPKGSSNMKFRFKQSDQIRGFIDKGTNMTGELESTGTLRIDGNFQGSISTVQNLIVGKQAVVHADIKVDEIEIHGQCFGNIEAKNRVEIFPSGRVRGDIHTPVLCVNAGAMLDGGIRMADERPDDPAASTDPVVEQPNTRLGRQ